MCWELGAGRVGRGGGSGSWAWCMLGLVSLSFKLVGICHQGVSIIFLFFLYTQSIHRICGVSVGVSVCVGVWVFGCVTVFVLVGMALRLMRALHTQVTTCRWFESF